MHHSACFAHFIGLNWNRVRIFDSSCVISLLFPPFSKHFSSPPAPTSPPSSSSKSAARSWCQSTRAPARWREAGRLADSSPHTRMMRDPRAQGNLLELHKSSLHGEGILKFYKRNGEALQFMRRSQWKPTRPIYWRGDLWHRQWKQPYILGRGSWRIWKSTWLQNSRISRVFDTTQTIDTGTFWRYSECGMPEIFITIMRDQCWQMIRRSSGQRQEFLSTLILFYVLVRWNKFKEKQKSGKANLKTLRCIHHIRMQWESMEKQLN